jgi:hypothetical protein
VFAFPQKKEKRVRGEKLAAAAINLLSSTHAHEYELYYCALMKSFIMWLLTHAAEEWRRMKLFNFQTRNGESF